MIWRKRLDSNVHSSKLDSTFITLAAVCRPPPLLIATRAAADDATDHLVKWTISIRPTEQRRLKRSKSIRDVEEWSDRQKDEAPGSMGARQECGSVRVRPSAVPLCNCPAKQESVCHWTVPCSGQTARRPFTMKGNPEPLREIKVTSQSQCYAPLKKFCKRTGTKRNELKSREYCGLILDIRLCLVPCECHYDMPILLTTCPLRGR